MGAHPPCGSGSLVVTLACSGGRGRGGRGRGVGWEVQEAYVVWLSS